MTVRELIAELEQCNPDYLVVLSRDPEGNLPFRRLYEVDPDSSVFDGWGTHIRELTDNLRSLGYTEEDLGEGEPCIILWPSE